jgi:hypothetical protein
MKRKVLCIAVLVGVGLLLPGLAHAAPPCGQKQILIAYADTEGPPTQLRDALLAESGVTAVDYFGANQGTPTIDQLNAYNLVITFSNSPYMDAVALGDVLADYQDSGVGLVQQVSFSFYGPGQPYGVNGRWATDGYSPFNYSTTLLTNTATLGTFDAGHPLMQGVTALSTNFRIGVTVASGATQVAAGMMRCRWSRTKTASSGSTGRAPARPGHNREKMVSGGPALPYSPAADSASATRRRRHRRS